MSFREEHCGISNNPVLWTAARLRYRMNAYPLNYQRAWLNRKLWLELGAGNFEVFKKLMHAANNGHRFPNRRR